MSDIYCKKCQRRRIYCGRRSVKREKNPRRLFTIFHDDTGSECQCYFRNFKNDGMSIIKKYSWPFFGSGERNRVGQNHVVNKGDQKCGLDSKSDQCWLN